MSRRVCQNCGGHVDDIACFCGYCGVRLSETVRLSQDVELKVRQVPAKKFFLGRDAELKRLPELTHHALNRRGRVVYVEGVAGSGKTAFASQAAAYWRANGFRVIRVTGVPEYNRFTYHPFHQFIVKLVGITPNIPSSKLASLLGALRSFGLKRVDLDYLYHLFPVELKDSKNRQLDNKVRLAGLTSALTRLIRHASRKQPLALIMDHLHWADPLTQQYTKVLEEAVANDAIVLMITTREEETLLDYKDNIDSIKLGPIGLKDIITISRLYMNVTKLPMEAEERLSQVADGNPLTAFLFCDYLVEREYLVKKGGTWQVSDKHRNSELPDTLEKIMAARLELMKPHIQELLRLTAVFAGECTLHGLQELYPYPQYVKEDIEELVRKHLVRVNTEVDRRLISFTHNYIHEYIYSRIPPAGLQALHPKVGERLGRMAPVQAYMKDWMMAHHLSFVGDKSAASAPFLDDSGNHLMRRLHFWEAIHCFQRESAILRWQSRNEKGSGEVYQHKMLDVLARLALCYHAVGDSERAVKTYQLIIERAAKIDAVYAATDARLAAMDLLVSLGRAEEARQLLEEGLEKVGADGDPYNRSRLRAQLGEWFRLQGLHREAEPLLLSALEEATDVEEGVMSRIRWSPSIRQSQGRLRVDQEQFNEALPLLVEAYDGFTEARDIKNMMQLADRLARLYAARRNYERAMGFVDLGLNIARNSGDVMSLINLTYEAGQIHQGTGELKKARLAFDDAFQLSTGIHWVQGIERSRLALNRLKEDSDGAV